MGPADSRRIARVPRYSGYRPREAVVRVRGSHPLRPAFPDRSAPTAPRAMAALQPRGRRNAPGLGCSPFARRYWGNHSCFLFLRVLRCFSSPRGPPRITRGCHPFRVAGCPIREPADQRLHAPPRGFSQLAAPFVASWSQGIHRTPLTASRGPVSRVLLNLVLFRTRKFMRARVCHNMSWIS